ncbi:MAG: S1 RNA-binding domain-containing protein, partial [Candidatus Subteraquimicrobiales bacterium]|nr:S1 RNA-binding domain-containing protein [Candidatus Subteraquimicrobiales bacterium]
MGKTINEQSIIAEEENFVLDYDKTIKVFRGGDLVKGTVVKIDRDGILVDVGYKSEGIIPPTEVSIRSGAYSCEILSVGDEVEVVVLQVEDKEGRMVLSRRRAKTEKAWRELELAKEEEKVIEGEVIEVVKGGLILDIGLRGFLPASLVDVVSIKDLRECLGKKFECKIIEMNKSRN